MKTKNSFKPKEFEKKCWHCGTIFIGHNANKYCSNQCHLDYYTDKSAGPDACWLFTGGNRKGKHRNNSSNLEVNGVKLPIRQHAWIQNYGTIPEGKTVNNLCANKLCINHKHLTLVDKGNVIKSCYYCGKTFVGCGATKYCSIECGFDACTDKTSDPNGCWIWTRGRHKNGLKEITANGKRHSTAKFIYEKFNNVIVPNTLVIFPTCGNPDCVNPEHLSTRPREQFTIGTQQRGDTHYKTTLTAELAAAIYISNESTESLAEEYNVNISVIRSIRSGRTWNHITESLPKPDIIRTNRSTLDKDEIIDIYLSKKSVAELAKKYGVNRSTIYNIRRGDTRQNITKDLINPRNKGKHNHE